MDQEKRDRWAARGKAAWLLATGVLAIAQSEGADVERPEIAPGAYLQFEDLSNLDLCKADLRGADLSHADLSSTNLSGADLSDANLSGADLSWANLLHADLSRADLTNANLSYASTTGMDLSGADLTGADLGSGLGGLVIYSGTTMPDGSVHD